MSARTSRVDELEKRAKLLAAGRGEGSDLSRAAAGLLRVFGADVKAVMAWVNALPDGLTAAAVADLIGAEPVRDRGDRATALPEATAEAKGDAQPIGIPSGAQAWQAEADAALVDVVLAVSEDDPALIETEVVQRVVADEEAGE